MNVTIDGQNLFDEQLLEIQTASQSRDSIERTVADLDGVLSIDLGQRSRQIIQKGQLRAKSKMQMNSKIKAISACLDGKTHTLVTSDGETFENLRMDVFKLGKEQTSGAGLTINYEIVYTQLRIE